MAAGPRKHGPTAGLVIIGNELLSGRVPDENTPFLTRRLYELGVEVREIRVVADEMDTIATAVREASERFDFVFTSGGIGPTHDDLTIPAVAMALNRKVVSSPGLERLLKQYYGVDELTLAQGRLAEIPEGAELIYPEGTDYPQVVLGNVYIFPGIPSLLRKKFELIASLFEGEPLHFRKLEMEVSETDIAGVVSAAAERFPAVRIGSYPRHLGNRWEVELTFEARDLELLEEALRYLQEQLSTPYRSSV